MNVVLEGIDGCGKSKQAGRLVERLGSKFWKFPNKDTPTGKLIYEYLEGEWGVSEPHGQPQYLSAMVFQALQVMNRMEVAAELDKDFRSARSTVLDRYWPSGYAYGKADGLDGQYLINVHTALPQPDLFILLDVSLETSIERRPERRDKYEKNAAFLNDVINNYRELWASKGGVSSWAVVDARGKVEETAKAIDDAIARRRLSME